MRGVCRLASALVILAACDGSSRAGDESRSPAAPADAGPTPRLVATATVHGAEPLKAPPPLPPAPRAGGPEYERVLAARLLPDTREDPPVHLSPTDETDLSRYQGAGWQIGPAAEQVAASQARFSARFDRFTSGVMTITLDTTLARHGLTAPVDAAPVDSIAIAGLGRRERVALTCRLAGFERDDRIIGLLSNETTERWMPVRRAWVLDTTQMRIRPIRTVGVSCLREEPD